MLDDGAYDYKKCSESEDRILQQYKLTDTELKAVAALQGQVQRTMKKLQDCRVDQ